MNYVCVSIVLYFIFLPFCIGNLNHSDCYSSDSSGICRCDPGYQLNPKTNVCKEISLPDGYDSNSTTEMQSSAIYEDFINSIPDVSVNCQNDCSDGSCIDGLCQKQTSSSIEENTSIIPTTDVTQNCQNECLEGICINGTCQNREGNFTQSSSEIDDDGDDDITSNCQNGCWGGICYDGICQCRDGLILNEDSNDCIMPCETTCQNGVCNQDRICECNQGYIHQNQSGCVPQCDRECVNSICVAPTRCECFEGDILNWNFSTVLMECIPTCEGVNGEKECLNGTCVAFNKCQCFNGFAPKSDGDRFECVAISGHNTVSYANNFPRKFVFLLLWMIVILTMFTLMVLVCLAHKRMSRVSYNVNKIEQIHSTSVVFQNHEKLLECAF